MQWQGKSIPFGLNRSRAFAPTKDALGKLSIEQAVADSVAFLNFAKTKQPKRDEADPDAPIRVIAFGGSYSGKLSAYLRYSAPHVCDGALAASAPVLLDGVGLGVSQVWLHHLFSTNLATS